MQLVAALTQLERHENGGVTDAIGAYWHANGWSPLSLLLGSPANCAVFHFCTALSHFSAGSLRKTGISHGTVLPVHHKIKDSVSWLVSNLYGRINSTLEWVCGGRCCCDGDCRSNHYEFNTKHSKQLTIKYNSRIGIIGGEQIG